jgi:hypothetical protein
MVFVCVQFPPSLFPNNRWAAGTGLACDAAGNQTAITTPAHSFVYDAENRLTQ